jgi:hypothetical protein
MVAAACRFLLVSIRVIRVIRGRFLLVSAGYGRGDKTTDFTDDTDKVLYNKFVRQD